jgi:hypothetical protein
MADLRYNHRRAPSGAHVVTLTYDPHTISGRSMPIHVGAEGATAKQAITRAAVALRALSSNPVAAAIMPPGTALAIEAINRLVSSSDIKRTVSRFAGKGARRLARVFGF